VEVDLQLLPQTVYLKNRIADSMEQENQTANLALAAVYLKHRAANLIPGPRGTPGGMKTGKGYQPG
jgi:hypothetical protein